MVQIAAFPGLGGSLWFVLLYSVPLWGFWWLCGRCFFVVVSLYVRACFRLWCTKIKPSRIAPGGFWGLGLSGADCFKIAVVFGSLVIAEGLP